MNAKSAGKCFNLGYVDNDLGRYEEFCKRAERLKEHGTVNVLVGSLAEKTPYDTGGRTCPWHDYLNLLPSLSVTFPHPKIAPHIPARHVKRNRELILAKAEIAAEHGFGGTFFAPEPHFLPLSFFNEHPHLRGPRVDHPRRSVKEAFAPCVDHPEVLEMYEWMLCEMKRAMPNLHSFVFRINDVGSGVCWSAWLYNGRNGPEHCRNRNPAERLVGLIEAMHRGAEAGGGRIRIGFNGNFSHNEPYAIIPLLPPDTAFHGWRDDGFVAHSSQSRPYPVRGIVNPLAVLTAMGRISDPANEIAGLNFSGYYNRSVDRFDNIDKVFDLVEEGMAGAGEPTNARFDRLHSLAARWGGEKNADALFDALLAIRDVFTLGERTVGGSLSRYLGVTVRHITRPLVARPDRLTPEEEGYFLPHIFNIHETLARSDWIDLHGGRVTLDPWIRKIAGQAVGAARMLEQIEGAPEQEWLERTALGLRAWASILRSVCNFHDAQVIRDRNAEALASEERIIPEQKGTETGHPDSVPWNELMRNELDNTQDLLDIIEKTGGDIVALAATSEEEDSFVLGPDLADQLRKKMAIMEKYWRDVEGYIATPHR